MRFIDRILLIIELHPNGLTNSQILAIMRPRDEQNQETRSQDLTDISARCRTLEKQGLVRREYVGRSPVWFPIKEDDKNEV